MSWNGLFSVCEDFSEIERNKVVRGPESQGIYGKGLVRGRVGGEPRNLLHYSMENLSGFKYGVRAIKARLESRVMSNGVVVRFYSWADGGLSRKKTPASRFNRVVLTP
jgi:hypothetical protein